MHKFSEVANRSPIKCPLGLAQGQDACARSLLVFWMA